MVRTEGLGRTNWCSFLIRYGGEHVSKHLFGIICTHHGTSANNRGETEGNITTLQKILWNDTVHTTVSAEALRWAIRYFWQRHNLPINRRWQEGSNRHTWEDADFAQGPEAFIDDDVLGFMSARAASEEGNVGEQSPGRRGRARGTTTVRRARLEVTRAVSLTPWAGDVIFNFASIGATPSAARRGDFPVPYGTEVHATRYQYGFALTPESLAVPSRALEVVEALTRLGEVAGNHARFLFDFSPESVIFRWTDDFAPRMLYAFMDGGHGQVRVRGLIERVEAGDIKPEELVVGGAIAATADGAALKEKGAIIYPGVLQAAEEAKRRVKEHLSMRG
jgi:CRISPR-associated protein Cst2